MTPREMLELAAKAAGYTVNANMQAERDALGCGDAGLWIDGVSPCWNPRNSREHSFVLALCIGVLVWRDSDLIWVGGRYVLIQEGDDAIEIAMKMIFEAAVEIGKAMP